MKHSFNFKSLIKIVVYGILTLIISGTLTCFCADKPIPVTINTVPMLKDNYDLSSIATNKNGLSIAHSNQGGIIYSSDGINWEEDPDRNNYFYKVKWDGNEFLGFKNDECGGLESSHDGLNWENLTSETVITGAARGRTWDKKGAKDILVLVGSKGEIITSYDMKNFNHVKTNTPCELTDICFNGKFFLAVGEQGIVLKSYDGQKWDRSSIGCNLESNSIIWDGKQFVCAGEEGEIYTSADGTKWKTISSGTSQQLNSISFYNGRYVTVGNNGTILFSSDSLNWKKVNSGTTSDICGCTWNGKLFICAGHDNAILTSADGVNWCNSIHRINNEINAMAYGNKTYTAVGDEGQIITSDDMKNWHNSILQSAENIYGIDFDGKEFTAVGEDGTFFSSCNGHDWNEFNITVDGTNYTLTKNLKCILHANGKIIAAGEDGTIIYSTDSKKWKAAASGTYKEIKALSYNGKEFAAVGAQGTLLKSSDGLKWNAVKIDTQNDLNTIYANNKGYLIGGNSGTILKGSNLNNLKPVTLHTGGNIHWISYDGFNYFLGGSNGFMGYSSDGENWGNLAEYLYDSRNTDISLGDLKASCFFTEKGITNYVICGSNGAILYGKISSKLNNPETKNGDELFANNDKKLIAGESGDFVNINDCIYAGNKFVAVGSNSLKTSVDGTNWVEHYNIETQGQLASYSKIYYVNKKYIAIGYNNCSYSDDGSKWKDISILNLPKDTYLDVVSSYYDGKKIYIIANITGGGYSKHLLTSYDGLKWDDCGVIYHSDDQLIPGKKLAFLKNKFYATNYAEASIITSTDGKKWSKLDIKLPNSSTNMINKIKIIDNTIFVLTARGLIAKSTDGLNFKFIDSGKVYSLTDIIKFKNKYIAIGNGILISDDGTKWSCIDTSKCNEIFSMLIPLRKSASLCSSDKKLIIVGLGNSIISSDDGINYQERVAANADIHSITNNGHVFAAVGQTIISSTDGISWYVRQNSNTIPSFLEKVVFANHKFIASRAFSQQSFASDDGVTWSIQKQSDSGSNARAILSNGNSFIRQEDTKLLISVDGVHWNSRDINLSSDIKIKTLSLTDIEKAGNKYFVVASSWGIPANYVCETDDGIKKLSCVISEGQIEFSKVVYYSNKYYVYGADQHGNEYLWTSADGLKWTKQKLSTNDFPLSIVNDGKKLTCFMSTGGIYSNTGYFAYSYDGIKFIKSTPTFESKGINISFNGNVYVGAGSKDTIWTSYDGVKWVNRILYYDQSFGGICK